MQTNQEQQEEQQDLQELSQVMFAGMDGIMDRFVAPEYLPALAMELAKNTMYGSEELADILYSAQMVFNTITPFVHPERVEIWCGFKTEILSVLAKYSQQMEDTDDVDLILSMHTSAKVEMEGVAFRYGIF